METGSHNESRLRLRRLLEPRKAVWAAVLACAVALAPGPGSSRAEEAPTEVWLESPGATQAALILRGEPRPEVLPLPARLPAARWESVEHLWVWSPVCPVRRVTPEELADFRCEVADEWLEVRIEWPEAGRAPREPGELIAAPSPTWIEIPEVLLPRWRPDKTGAFRVPVRRGEPLRLRFVSAGWASGWRDVPAGQRALTLKPEPARCRSVSVVGERGTPEDRASLSLFLPGRSDDTFKAFFLADPQGRIQVDPVPSDLEIAVVAIAQGMLPARLQIVAERLPDQIVLESGCFAVGSLVGNDGKPLADADVSGEGYVGGGSGILVAQSTASDRRGEFRVGPLPRGPVVLAVGAQGRTKVVKRVFLGECDREQSVGTITLSRAIAVGLRVLDEAGSPVGGASIVTAAGERSWSDESGRALLEFVADSEPLSLVVSAEGYRSLERTLDPPFPEVVALVLRRAARVTGRLVSETGEPMDTARVEVHEGTSFREEPIGPGGELDLEVAPGRRHRLRLLSDSAIEVVRDVEALDAGSSFDLGVVVLPAGQTVRGRVLHADSGDPVAGARIWMPRGGFVDAAIVDWALGDTVETRSDVTGGFRLTGLAHGPAVVRIEARGLAPSEIEIRPGEENGEIDLGEVFLGPGAEVRIHQDLRDGALARIDWKRQWRELDMILATFIDGEARVSSVPAGAALLTVLDHGEQVCERNIQIPDRGVLDVDCDSARLRVRGEVRVAGARAGSGTLIWLSSTAGDTLILNRRSPLGANESRIYGAGRPQVNVEVRADGHFETDSLVAGIWHVIWRPDQGGTSRSREVELPDVSDWVVELDFAPHALSGVVVDRRGSPVAEARVEDLDLRAATRSNEAGAFTLLDVEPGTHRLMARKAGLRSEPVTVEVAPDRPAEPVTLVLEREDEELLRVTVEGDAGPAAGSLVFLEGDADHGLVLLTSDANGLATSRLYPPWPRHVRAAAFAGGSLVLGSWAPLERALREGLALDVEESTALEIRREGPPTAVDIVSADGWNVAGLLRHVGFLTTVSSDRPLRLDGIPPGTYRVIARSMTAQAADSPTERVVLLRAGDVVTVRLDR